MPSLKRPVPKQAQEPSILDKLNTVAKAYVKDEGYEGRAKPSNYRHQKPKKLI